MKFFKSPIRVGVLLVLGYSAFSIHDFYHQNFVFAAIGDYGQDRRGHNDDVAKLVKSWSPDFIITLGDNLYRKKNSDKMDPIVGRLYGEYIYPYKGAYSNGSPTKSNRFWPALGNHDWSGGGIVEYLEYFSLPNNERYYEQRIGDVHLFCLSIYNEPDGIGKDSKQAKWIKQKLLASDAPWKIVYSHYPPYSSSQHGGKEELRWPFSEWGSSVVLAGHDHYYERLDVNGTPYFVNGLGGGRRYTTHEVDERSMFRYNDNYGAMKISGNSQRLKFEFINVDNQVIDKYEVIKPGFWEWVNKL